MRKLCLPVLISLTLTAGCGGGGGGSDTVAGGGNPGNGATPASKSWGTPVVIEGSTAPTGEIVVARYPQIATSAAGDGLAIWQEEISTGISIFANSYSVSSGWGMAKQIDSAGGRPQVLAVDMDRDGDALAVWHHDDGLHFAAFSPTVGWSSEELIAPSADWVADFAVKFSAPGLAIAVWSGADVNGSRIWSSSYDQISGWTAPVALSEYGASSPALAVNSAGGAFVVWRQSDGVDSQIVTRLRAANGGWESAQRIDDSVEEKLAPQIALNDSGVATAVWEQRNTAIDRPFLWSNRYIPGNGWSTPELIRTENVWGAGSVQVEIDAVGNVIAVWGQREAEPTSTGVIGIWGNRYIAGTGWGTEEEVSLRNAGNASDLQLASGYDGSAIAIWSQKSSDGKNNIFVNRYTFEDGWGVEEGFERSARVHAVDPQIAIDANGKAIAVWRQEDETAPFGGQPVSVWANRFE